MSAYNQWRDDPNRAHEEYICQDRSSPHCAAWVCEHIQKHLLGHYVPISWRKAIDKLMDSRDKVTSYDRVSGAESEQGVATQETEVESNSAERESGVATEAIPQR
jgi:hypothetical protein